MVDAKSVAAVVTGALLTIVGGVGALVAIVGVLAGVVEWSLLAWTLPLAVVVGVGLFTYGAVDLASELWRTVSDDGLGGLTDEVDVARLRRLID